MARMSINRELRRSQGGAQHGSRRARFVVKGSSFSSGRMCSRRGVMGLPCVGRLKSSLKGTRAGAGCGVSLHRKPDFLGCDTSSCIPSPMR